MGRARRSLFWVLFLSVFFFSRHSVFAETAPAPNTELDGILQKIDSRNYRWVAIRADTLLFFAVAGDSRAMCGGELLYQRLEERMLLTCADAERELVFVFRTFDRRFDLYIPSQNTVYHGSIFDMEDSPEIESHLKARDLYRALKPLAVDPRRAKLERTNSLVTNIDVYGRGNAEGALARKLYLTPEGDVRGELFYSSEGKPVTEIQRYDFQKLPGRGHSSDPVIFPKKITIFSPATKKGSVIFFTRVKALDNINPLEFSLRAPYGAKEVFLEEKNTPVQRLQKPVPKTSLSSETVPSPPLKPISKKKPSTKTEKPSGISMAKKEAVVPEKAPDSSSGMKAAVLTEPATQGASSDATLDPSVDPKI